MSTAKEQAPQRPARYPKPASLAAFRTANKKGWVRRDLAAKEAAAVYRSGRARAYEPAPDREAPRPCACCHQAPADRGRPWCAHCRHAVAAHGCDPARPEDVLACACTGCDLYEHHNRLRLEDTMTTPTTATNHAPQPTNTPHCSWNQQGETCDKPVKCHRGATAGLCRVHASLTHQRAYRTRKAAETARAAAKAASTTKRAAKTTAPAPTPRARKAPAAPVPAVRMDPSARVLATGSTREVVTALLTAAEEIARLRRYLTDGVVDALLAKAKASESAAP